MRVSAKANRTIDNFRDNVEQVLIDSPSPKKYRVIVSHKGDLKFDVQQYALVFTAGTLDGATETLYWIGTNSGNWNDGKTGVCLQMVLQPIKFQMKGLEWFLKELMPVL